MNHAWDLSAWLPAPSSPLYWLYVVLNAMFQVNLQPTVLQAVGWLVYIIPVLILLTIQIRGTSPGRPAAQVARGEAAAVHSPELSKAEQAPTT